MNYSTINYSHLIQQLMKEKGLNRTLLAKALGLSRSGIVKMLKRNNFQISTLQRVSKALDYDLLQHLPAKETYQSLLEAPLQENAQLKKQNKDLSSRLQDQETTYGTQLKEHSARIEELESSLLKEKDAFRELNTQLLLKEKEIEMLREMGGMKGST